MKALWKTLDGQEFIVEGKDINEIQSKISELRKIHNIEKPDFVAAQSNDPEINKQIKAIAAADINDLPEKEQAAIKQVQNNALNKNKKLD